MEKQGLYKTRKGGAVVRELIANIFLKIKLFFDMLDSPPCYKESLGYHCRHRAYPDGRKECGPS